MRILFMLIITNGSRTQKAHYNCTKIYIVGHGTQSIKARYNNKHGQHSETILVALIFVFVFVFVFQFSLSTLD